MLAARYTFLGMNRQPVVDDRFDFRMAGVGYLGEFRFGHFRPLFAFALFLFAGRIQIRASVVG